MKDISALLKSLLNINPDIFLAIRGKLTQPARLGSNHSLQYWATCHPHICVCVVTGICVFPQILLCYVTFQYMISQLILSGVWTVCACLCVSTLTRQANDWLVASAVYRRDIRLSVTLLPNRDNSCLSVCIHSCFFTVKYLFVHQ